MSKRLLICIDTRAHSAAAPWRNPDGSVEPSPFVLVESRAEQCRALAKASCDIDEAWVVSCEDMEAINVAAAIKRDDPGKRVYLVTDEQSGSLASRAVTAGIDGLRSSAMLAKRYEGIVSAADSQRGAERKAIERRAADPQKNDAVHPGCEHGAPADPDGLSCNEAKRETGVSAGAFRAVSAGAGMPPSVSRELYQDDYDLEADFDIEPAVSPTSTSAPFDLRGSDRSPISAAPSSSASAAAASVMKEPPPLALRPEKRDCSGLDIVVSPSFSVPGSPTVEGPATVVAVVSGTGGCGKSTLSAVFALLGNRAGLRTAVFDADFQFGDLDYLLGIANPLRIEDAIGNPSLLSDTVSSAGDGPFLLAAPRRVEMSELVAGATPALTAALRKSFDLVVVNTGSLWTDGHAGILETADAVVFLMDSRPSSLRATVHAVELCTRLGVATTGFAFAVNRHDKSSLLSAVDVSCALRGARAQELADGGRDVDELLGAGYPGELVNSKNAFVADARSLLAEILPGRRGEVVRGAGDEPKRRRSLFGRGGR